LVDLIVEAEAWAQALPDLEATIDKGAALALTAADLPPDAYEICVLACDDDRIAALNAEHRGKPGPTNVLSWPGEDLSPEAPGGRPRAPAQGPDGMRTPLGDVAIALQTVEREAAAASIPLKNHVIHLILHGSLHLLGYDHETPEDAERMEGLESRALVAAGFPDPYVR
jgi:probable rRNA maturation factor